MESSCFSFALLIFLLNSTTICLSSSIFNLSTDKHALVSFKNSITSDPHATLATNWSDATSVCNWIGVSCGPKHRRVVALNLSRYDLAGTLTPHLGNLTFLRYLDLSFNYFMGFLPSELSKLRRLKVMNARGNSITGELPTWLGSLPQLEQLILYNNSFSGGISSSFFNNSKLQVLSMSFNLLGGYIPEEIGNMSSLEIIYLDNNQLSGSIPRGMFNISTMRNIRIMNNSLTSSLPSDVCNNMPNLNTLYLSRNQLSGEIPPNIWKCRHLEFLALSLNHFIGKISSEIGISSLLRELYLGGNDLRGTIPSSTFNLSTLKILDLSYNEFSGSLPSDMGHSLNNLEFLRLIYNKLTGPIPSSIANSSRLTELYMNINSFSGLIPKFHNLRLLQHFGISENNLSGAESPTQEMEFLSSLTNCRYLRYLVISDNPLNGILPNSIGNFSTSLLYFYAANNNISGVIPSEIGKLSNVLFIILSGNQFTGPIPSTIRRIKKLQRLYLSYNQLVGSIPNDLCQLNHLGELSLYGNMLVGPIPECLGGVKSLRLLYLDSNKLNSTIPLKLWTLTDLLLLSLSSNEFSGQLSFELGRLKAINYLNLSFNQLTGNIPTIIDGCQSLDTLDLSNNLFSGSIPPSLGNVRVLTSLDLSYNNLSGFIPKSLEDLPFLLSFNVSYNKLEGEIPNSGHFGNFTAESFAHNLALCGPERFHVPPCSKKKNIVRLVKYVVPSLIVFFIVVIVMFVLVNRQREKKVPLPPDISPNVQWRRISYIELERGTSSFSETSLLGRGSFGSVFHATLFDGQKAAVKVFNMQLEGATRSFDTETEILNNIRHRNLVRVIGCCSNTEFRALILAYMPNGSLEKWLYSHIYCLDLMQRLKIAIDVALALEYLHHGYTFPVVHCDIKPSNVLLDEDMVAHLGDFGISKLFDGGEVVIQTQTLATIGYAAPEYGMEGKVSMNGDVYSFGIMVLEIFTGKRPTDDMFSGEMSLKEWVSEALQDNATTGIVAPALLTREDQHSSIKEQCVSSIFNLAMKCLAVSPDERINMIEAAATLQKIKETVVAGIGRPRQYAFSVNIRDNGL